jgi:uncharacterized YigZ family protein
MEDVFLTIQSPAEGYYMERGSKFLAYATPVHSEEEANHYLQHIKKIHPKGRHYCTALRLYPDASLERSSDDGEPSGSAGRPILGQVLKNNLTQVYVVVVRYFGGTKLGIPGLIEAYKTSAANALAAANIVERTVFVKVMIQLSYDVFPHFLNYCKQQEIPVFEETFAERASMIIGFRKSSCNAHLQQALQQFSQMDFEHWKEYAQHLDFEINILNDEAIM